jgi:hypothetical protein
MSLVAALAYACGGGSDAPTLPPGAGGPITVVEGGGQTDTVDATLKQALVVQIRDSTLRLVPGVTVRFTPVLASNQPYLLVAPVGGGYGTSNPASDVTNSFGHAKTVVSFARRTGTALLEVSVPELALVDTISFTITPGAPTQFIIAPRDTEASQASSYTLRASMADRYLNPIAGATPTFSATGVTISSSGQVSTASTSTPVRGRIVVTYGGAVR